jgi:signal transduction histidine kinase
MDALWIKSPTARRVLEHWADPRPTWLWSADGQTLLWRNLTARFFHGKAKKHGIKLAPEATPIRGQIQRLIRLGSPNRSSLSRIQFLAGDRPISATCACTPLEMANGQMALLIVDVDPISPDLLDKSIVNDPALEALFPQGADYLLIDDDVQIAGGSPHAIGHIAPVIQSEGLPELDANGSGRIDIEGVALSFTRFKASPQDASLLLFEGTAAAAGASAAPITVNADSPQRWETTEPLLPIGLPPAEPSAAPTTHSEVDEHWVTPLQEPAATGGLTSLFDRLADDSALFTPLGPDENFAFGQPPTEPAVELAGRVESAPQAEPILETVPPPLEEMVVEPAMVTGADASDGPATASESPAGEALVAEPAEAEAPPVEPMEPVELAEPVEPVGDVTLPAYVTETAAEDHVPTAAEAESVKPVLYRVVGRGFAPIATTVEAVAAEAVAVPEAEAEIVPSVGQDLVAAASPVDEPRVEEIPTVGASVVDEPLTTKTGDAATLPEETASPAAETPPGPAAATPDENVERVSRYNFDELSRILNDRVGGDSSASESSAPVAGVSYLAPRPTPPPEGSLVTLGGETLVLNRLPLGILVFRDQQVMFANRAITEMIGYESVESLRSAGLAAIFPSAGGEPQGAGPINHLVQRDGTLVPVTARLQSVSWQGRPALMLSASATEVRTGHEAAVRAFAEMLATTRSDGFIETARSGVMTMVSAEAGLILKRSEEQLVGRPISMIVASGDALALKEFLERPARFAETARPCISLKGADSNTDVLLFAQGQAGIITGYFGFVRYSPGAILPALAASPGGELDPALLARLSRGVRRPLNTVIGFSDLIGSAAFGPVDNERYLEYARDIKTAGLEIAALVDELDDYARLRDGRYTARPTDIDLVALLESSVTRVRGQASAARVLVRSAISERLPRIRADRASLAQAVLNLLASAIDQTTQDGSVVISAQVNDEGGIAVNVRDSSQSAADLSERFVVFRDGRGRDGEILSPMRSSVGLALTRSLLAVNACSLSVDPAGATGTLFSLTIPPENVVIGDAPVDNN